MKGMLVVLLGISSTAFAQVGGEWFQVKGGTWVPDADTLSIAEAKLRSALGSSHKVPAAQWHRYLFQYQGTVTSQGQRTIHINALCADLLALPLNGGHAKYDFTGTWLAPLAGGGGTCVFSANYDVAHRSVTDLEVNPSK